MQNQLDARSAIAASAKCTLQFAVCSLPFAVSSFRRKMGNVIEMPASPLSMINCHVPRSSSSFLC